MATVEIEIWADNVEDDYALLLTELDCEGALSLYQYLCAESKTWCESSAKDPELYRRTTGRDIRLADVLRWYEQEGLLEETDIDGETAFLPVDKVQSALEDRGPASTLLPLHE